MSWSFSGMSFTVLYCDSTMVSVSTEMIDITYSGYSTPITIPYLIDDSGTITQQVTVPATGTAAPPLTYTTPSTSDLPTGRTTIDLGALIGGLVGAVVLIVLVGSFYFSTRQRRARRKLPRLERPTGASDGLPSLKPELDGTSPAKPKRARRVKFEMSRVPRSELGVTRDPELDASSSPTGINHTQFEMAGLPRSELSAREIAELPTR
jgi:hypothetical protein